MTGNQDGGDWTRSGTPRLRAFVVLTACGLLAALLTGRPELAALAAPFGLLLTVGLAVSERPELALHVALSSERVMQGDGLTITITATSASGVARLDLLPVLDPGLRAAGPLTRTVRLSPGDPQVLDLTVAATRWGSFPVGSVQVSAFDRLGLVRFDRRAGRAERLKVLPDAGTLRTVIGPANTEVFAGEVLSRQRGGGIEFSEVRLFGAGDRIRDVNWRATARAGDLYVNQRLADRNADVVVFLDTFEDLRTAPGEPSSLDVAVSAAASVAGAYLRHRDRVGLVGWGGYLQWVTPGMGQVSLYRIVDVLLEARAVRSEAWRGVRILPARVLPPGSLVIALSPLLDPRLTNALFDLRSRGSDVAVIEVDPVAFQRPGVRREEVLAFRLWALSRQRIRRRLEDRGVVVATWDGGRPLEEVVREVETRRRQYRRRSG